MPRHHPLIDQYDHTQVLDMTVTLQSRETYEFDKAQPCLKTHLSAPVILQVGLTIANEFVNSYRSLCQGIIH